MRGEPAVVALENDQPRSRKESGLIRVSVRKTADYFGAPFSTKETIRLASATSISSGTFCPVVR